MKKEIYYKKYILSKKAFKIVIVCLYIFYLTTFQIHAQIKQANFPNDHFVINPNDHVLITLLQVVMTDLEMCYRNLLPTIKNEISAIGHLNNAQSALKKANLDPAYSPLITEIITRISKIKFYLVMQDFEGVKMRLQQLISIIRNILGNQYPSTYQPTNNNPYNYNYNPFGTTYDAPAMPKEIPINGISPLINNSFPTSNFPVEMHKLQPMPHK